MASKKRKCDDDSPEDPERANKISKADAEIGNPDHFFKVGRPMGPADAAITTSFKNLASDIKNFTAENFMGRPYIGPGKAEHNMFFDSLTNTDPLAYLKSTLRGPKEKIVRAAIWNKLITHLLGAPTGAYLHFSEADYKKRFSGDLERFCFWRALTASNAANNDTEPNDWGRDGPGREKFVNETVALLRKIAYLKNDDRKLARRLDGIAGQAFKLAKFMALSRAYWVCSMTYPQLQHSYKLNREWMVKENAVAGEVEDSGKGEENPNKDQEDSDDGDEDWKPDKGEDSIVDLVVSPMLLKFGNTSGEDYDKCDVFEQAHVVTDPPELPT